MSQHEQWDITSGVGITALAVAAARAVESSRPDRLIDDPFAAAFVKATHSPIPMPPRWPDEHAAVSNEEAGLLQGSCYIGLRSRFFDDYLLGACSDGVVQVVILAAGLDTRAFRIGWPSGSRLFEIDQPKVLEFKDAVLRDNGAQARCARTVVPIDLRGDWPTALRASGFDSEVPTAWLAEGLLPYLPADAEQRLFGYINDLSPAGSHLAVERAVDAAGLVDKGGLGQIRGNAGIAFDKLLHSDARPDPTTWLTEQGWAVTEEPANAAAGRYHRNLTDPRLSAFPAAAALRLADYTAFLSARR